MHHIAYLSPEHISLPASPPKQICLLSAIIPYILLQKVNGTIVLVVSSSVELEPAPSVKVDPYPITVATVSCAKTS